MANFDYENFDYDAAYQKVQSEIKKPNIFIVGATGAGKSSLINDIFNIDIAEVGRDGKPTTEGVNLYASPEFTVNLYDTEGYEIDSIADDYDNGHSKYFNDIIGFIDKRKRQYPENFEEHIHEVWYCVGSKRFYNVDKRIIDSILERKIPIAVIITKVDILDENELTELRAEIIRNVLNANIFTYSVEIPPKDEELYKQYVQKEELLQWAFLNLDDWFKAGFIDAVKGALKLKRNSLITKTIPWYAAAAAGAVGAVAFTPVPFGDSVPLMGIQVTMCYKICSTYGIKGNVGSLVKDIVGTSAVSYLGKTFAAQLVGLIPFFGNAAKLVANVTVATTLTFAIGAAVTVLCERYLEECVDKNGRENIPFIQFFSAENFKKAMEYVYKNKDEFQFDEIVNDIISKFSNKNKDDQK